MSINKKLATLLSNYLSKEPRNRLPNRNLTDYDRVCHEIIPGDVLLIEGHNRASKLIKRITASCWTHVALYIGRIHSIENEFIREIIRQHYQGKDSDQLFIDTMPGTGTRVVAAQHYKGHHIRICRPSGLSAPDTQQIIDFVAQHLGREYNIAHLFQLGLHIIAGGVTPRRWLASLFEHSRNQKGTRDICSALIAEAFIHVNFPVLPLIVSDKKNMEMIHRNPRLFKPCDFDYSPYYHIIKYPIYPGSHTGVYHHFPWRNDVTSHDDFITETPTDLIEQTEIIKD